MAKEELPRAGLIYQKIPAVMADVEAITKERTSQQGYKFRGIDDVLSALNPVFVKHRVFVLPEVLSQAREERTTKSGSAQIFTVLTVKFTICAEDGSSVYCVMMGEAQDTGDKSAGKAMSIAFKFMGFQVFCIPTDEPEMDTEKRTPESTRPRQAATPRAAQAPQRPVPRSDTTRPPASSTGPAPIQGKTRSSPTTSQTSRKPSPAAIPQRGGVSSELPPEDDVPNFDTGLAPEAERMAQAGSSGVPVESRDDLNKRLMPLWKQYLAVYPNIEPQRVLIERYEVTEVRQLSDDNIRDLIEFFTEMVKAKGRKK